MTDTEKLLKIGTETISSFYAEFPEEQAPPVLIGFKNDQPLQILPLEFTNALMKDICRQVGSQFLEKIGADACVFMSEAWMATAKSEDDAVNGLLPSEREDRVEVLLIEVSAKDAHLVVSYEMKRNEDGFLIGFEEIRRFEGDDPEVLRSRWDFFGDARRQKVH